MDATQRRVLAERLIAMADRMECGAAVFSWRTEKHDDAATLREAAAELGQ